ncbi:hypothetical protein N431DRAFT_557993 [Stipitochalara longipes BDJ]|nr:hypothetical protein N431DRAFT_557993 [Stipitochalara longipes BDJ]
MSPLTWITINKCSKNGPATLQRILIRSSHDTNRRAVGGHSIEGAGRVEFVRHGHQLPRPSPEDPLQAASRSLIVAEAEADPSRPIERPLQPPPHLSNASSSRDLYVDGLPKATPHRRVPVSRLEAGEGAA